MINPENRNNNDDDEDYDAEISSSWHTNVDPAIIDNVYNVDDSWLLPLQNIIKIGRSFYFGGHEPARRFYFTNVFPAFVGSLTNASVYEPITRAMSGELPFDEAAKIMAAKKTNTENQSLREICYLYEKVFYAMKEDTLAPSVQFERSFDLKSLETINMAIETPGDEIRTTPVVELAKRCSVVPGDGGGSLTLYGTNMLIKECRDFRARFSRSLLDALRMDFRFSTTDNDIAENNNNDVVRLGCRVENVDVYVNLGIINAAWTFDNDVARRFINIIEEPYPYDALRDISRIVVSVYITESNVSDTLRRHINEEILNKIFGSIRHSGPELYTGIVSHFSNYPLAAYWGGIGHIACNKYSVHDYLRAFKAPEDWSVITMNPRDVPLFLHFVLAKCALLVIRPPLHSTVLVLSTDPLPSIANIFTQYWSPEDIVELHAKIDTVTDFDEYEIVELLRRVQKIVCFKVYNGFLARNENDVDDELFDKYSKLLHLWLPTVNIDDFTRVVKTWPDDENQRVRNFIERSTAMAVQHFRETFTSSTKRWYIIKNTFECKINAVNLYVNNSREPFTVFFDYVVDFYDFDDQTHIRVDDDDKTKTGISLNTVESLEEATRLLDFDIKAQISSGKYVIRLRDLPGVVLVGKNWNETNAAELTKFHNRFSRNILHTVQSILCRSLIQNCIVGDR